MAKIFILGDNAFDDDLNRAVDRAFRGEDPLGVTLRAHLVIEQVLERRLAEMLPDANEVLGGGLARFGFMQKAALYLSLTGPHKTSELRDLLKGLNSIRNKAAHDLNPDLKSLVPRSLPMFFQRNQLPVNLDNEEDLLSVIKGAFMALVLNLRFAREFIERSREAFRR